MNFPTLFCSLSIRLMNLSVAVRPLKLGIFTFLYILFRSSLYRGHVHINAVHFQFLYSVHIFYPLFYSLQNTLFQILKGVFHIELYLKCPLKNEDFICFNSQLYVITKG